MLSIRRRVAGACRGRRGRTIRRRSRITTAILTGRQDRCSVTSPACGRGRSAAALRVREVPGNQGFVVSAPPSPAAARRPLPQAGEVMTCAPVLLIWLFIDRPLLQAGGDMRCACSGRVRSACRATAVLRLRWWPHLRLRLRCRFFGNRAGRRGAGRCLAGRRCLPSAIGFELTLGRDGRGDRAVAVVEFDHQKAERDIELPGWIGIGRLRCGRGRRLRHGRLRGRRPRLSNDVVADAHAGDGLDGKITRHGGRDRKHCAVLAPEIRLVCTRLG